MIVKESFSRDCLRLVVWYPLRWLILLLPVRMGILLLRTLGDIHYGISPRKRAQLSENYRRLNPDATSFSAIRHVTRAYLRNHYIDHLMIFIFPRMGPDEVAKYIEFEGLNHLNQALASNRGAILVHGHFGPVHLPLVCLSRIGYPMMQIGMPSDEGLSRIGRTVAFRLRMKYESLMPAAIIHARTFLRPVIRWLNQNGVVMITGDGTGTAEHVGRYDVFDFLGHRVSFPLGPALMSIKAGSMLLPLFIVPGNKKMYRIIIEPPICGGGEPVDSRPIVQKFIRRLEYYIQCWPGYMHFLDRFELGRLIESDCLNANQINRDQG